MQAPPLFKDNRLYTFGLAMLVAGLPLSLFLTSLSQFFLAGAFLLDGGDIRVKARRFLKNPVALSLTLIWLLHLLGLAWTESFAEGWKDVRIKLPLLILPLIMAGQQPLSPRQLRLVTGTFLLALLAGTMVSISVLYGIIQRPVTDIRDIFIFRISHIRFALFLCIGVYLILDRLRERQDGARVARTALLFLGTWFVVFLGIMESITGLGILLLTGCFFLLRSLFLNSSKSVRTGLFIALVLLLGSATWFIQGELRHSRLRHPSPLRFDEKTREGNAYAFELWDVTYENGYPVNVYVCEPELREYWNGRSTIPYDSLDRRGQPLRFTLIRYLASKGWRKDGAAVERLESGDITAIENGVANHLDRDRSGLRSRLRQILWEIDVYRQGGNPSGHSVTQRLEFWRAALGIIGRHPWTGVGTGDLRQAYSAEYERMKTRLEPEYRLRSHNQYLAIAVAFGIPGLLFFCYCWLRILTRGGATGDLLVLSAWLIATLSMMTEDTLETQPGATFVAFFLCLFLLARPVKAA